METRLNVTVACNEVFNKFWAIPNMQKITKSLNKTERDIKDEVYYLISDVFNFKTLTFNDVNKCVWAMIYNFISYYSVWHLYKDILTPLDDNGEIDFDYSEGAPDPENSYYTVTFNVMTKDDLRVSIAPTCLTGSCKDWLEAFESWLTKGRVLANIPITTWVQEDSDEIIERDIEVAKIPQFIDKYIK